MLTALETVFYEQKSEVIDIKMADSDPESPFQSFKIAYFLKERLGDLIDKFISQISNSNESQKLLTSIKDLIKKYISEPIVPRVRTFKKREEIPLEALEKHEKFLARHTIYVEERGALVKRTRFLRDERNDIIKLVQSQGRKYKKHEANKIRENDKIIIELDKKVDSMDAEMSAYKDHCNLEFAIEHNNRPNNITRSSNVKAEKSSITYLNETYNIVSNISELEAKIIKLNEELKNFMEKEKDYNKLLSENKERINFLELKFSSVEQIKKDDFPLADFIDSLFKPDFNQSKYPENIKKIATEALDKFINLKTSEIMKKNETEVLACARRLERAEQISKDYMQRAIKMEKEKKEITGELLNLKQDYLEKERYIKQFQSIQVSGLLSKPLYEKFLLDNHYTLAELHEYSFMIHHIQDEYENAFLKASKNDCTFKKKMIFL